MALRTEREIDAAVREDLIRALRRPGDSAAAQKLLAHDAGRLAPVLDYDLDAFVPLAHLEKNVEWVNEVVTDLMQAVARKQASTVEAPTRKVGDFREEQAREIGKAFTRWLLEDLPDELADLDRWLFPARSVGRQRPLSGFAAFLPAACVAGLDRWLSATRSVRRRRLLTRFDEIALEAAGSAAIPLGELGMSPLTVIDATHGVAIYLRRLYRIRHLPRHDAILLVLDRAYLRSDVPSTDSSHRVGEDELVHEVALTTDLDEPVARPLFRWLAHVAGKGHRRFLFDEFEAEETGLGLTLKPAEVIPDLWRMWSADLSGGASTLSFAG